MSGNEEQIDYWNGKAGETWVEAQDRIDRTLAGLTEQALVRANPQAHERVLDIGCGCGTTTLALAGKASHVTGVDISAPMLALARQRTSGMDNVAFEQADAAERSFAPDFELIFSRFGVMFFSDPVAAFSNIHHALAPAGRMILLCWQAPASNPWMSTAGRIVQPFLAEANPDAPAPDPKAPGPFAFGDGDYVREILEAAGFTQIRLDVAKADIKLGDTVDEAMDFQSRIGPLSRALTELDGDAREQALAAVRSEFERLAGPDGLTLGAAAWLVSARG